MVGRFTRDISNYELTLPHRVTHGGVFISFAIPQFFTHKFFREKRQISDGKLYYNVIFNGKDHHIELWPNHEFISPNLVSEVYRASLPVGDRKLKRMTEKLCHYVGNVNGRKRLSAALSLCNGMAGYIMTNNGQYFIEPLAGHQPNSRGEHIHVIYKRDIEHPLDTLAVNPPKCGSTEKWTDAWERRIYEEEIKKRENKDKENSVEKKDEKESKKEGDKEGGKEEGNGKVEEGSKAEGNGKVEEGSAGSHSKHSYLELLVVVDHKFIDYHKNDNMEEYILTIMNMVFNYYHDASVGHQMDVHVVRIIYLEKIDKSLDLEISSNAEVTLESFCNWAKTVNPTDVENAQHHDISVLMTRYDLCSDNVTDCNLMGLAYLAAACDSNKSCAINEDSGLALGITVTHEVGHVMGCGHDNSGEDSPCAPQNKAGEYYIMSPYVHMQTTEWSPCSKKFITQLFENKLGECLYDVPQQSIYKENDLLPGSVYDADYQCNIAFPESTHCILEQSKICEVLYCRKPEATSCLSKGQPPADGTKCGENMWCYNTKCVEMGQRPATVDGGWGPWGSWSECSRTCGGGIAFSERECNNPLPANKGRYCLGERKRVKLCNTNACPVGEIPFRDKQCLDYNTKPFQGGLHKWKPYFKKEEPCALTCINENHVFVTLSPRVIDGTSCKMGTKYRCIFGTCRKVGCDWVIDSDAAEDICGVCNGDGSHCTVVENVFNETGSGYKKIVTIPAGSRNIEIHEKAASENTIAISNDSGKHFYLNGDFKEEVNGDYDFGGVRGIYDHPSVDKESLFIVGPLVTPITLHAVFYNPNNPGISYKYSQPLPPGQKPPESQPEFNWEFVEFGECSTRCGPGQKISVPECIEKKQGKVGEHFCEKKPKPEPKTMSCNLRPCHYEWHARNWGPCSGCKGKTGTRTRLIDCSKENPESGKEPIIVEDSHCSGKKPAASEVCCSNKPCLKKRFVDEVDERIAKLWEQLEEIKRKRKIKKAQEQLESEPQKVAKLLAGKYIRKFAAEPSMTYGRPSDKFRLNKYKKLYVIQKRNKDKHENHEKGSLITDNLPPEGQKLIEVPLKQDHETVKLTDTAFETEGDKVIDTLDFCNAKIFVGKEADKELKKVSKTHDGEC